MGEPAKHIMRIERRILMRDIAYERIKDAIEKGIFKPHTRLIEEKVASIIGTSRTPVREVFQRLEKDGLIYKRQKGGYAVADSVNISNNDYLELSVGLIGYAVYLAVRKISDHAIKTFEDIIKEEEISIELNDLNAFYANNLRFYRTICACCENKALLNLSRLLSVKNFIINGSNKSLQRLNRKRLQLHKNIVLHIRKKNPYLAEKYAREDLSIYLKNCDFLLTS